MAIEGTVPGTRTEDDQRDDCPRLPRILGARGRKDGRPDGLLGDDGVGVHGGRRPSAGVQLGPGRGGPGRVRRRRSLVECRELGRRPDGAVAGGRIDLARGRRWRPGRRHGGWIRTRRAGRDQNQRQSEPSDARANRRTDSHQHHRSFTPHGRAKRTLSGRSPATGPEHGRGRRAWSLGNSNRAACRSDRRRRRRPGEVYLRCAGRHRQRRKPSRDDVNAGPDPRLGRSGEAPTVGGIQRALGCEPLV